VSKKSRHYDLSSQLFYGSPKRCVVLESSPWRSFGFEFEIHFSSSNFSNLLMFKIFLSKMPSFLICPYKNRYVVKFIPRLGRAESGDSNEKRRQPRKSFSRDASMPKVK
jgi:hypothetical protein